MPVASYRPDAETGVKTSIPVINDLKGNSPVVDTRRTPLHSLITFVEGSVYVVDYYSQILTRDSSLYAQDTTQTAEYQQYKKINRLEIKMTSPLSETQDDENKQFTVKGTGVVHSTLIPNEGDMFAGDVGDGREGVFQVDTSRKLTIRMDSAYEIQFTLLYFTNVEPDRRKDLDAKTVVEYHYMAEFLASGQTPLVSTAQFNTIEALHRSFDQLVKHYFRWFLSKEYGTLILPGQDQPIYDPFVAKFMSQILEIQEAPELLKLRLVNIQDDNALKDPQLYEALIQRDPGMLTYANMKMGLMGTAQFARDPMLSGIRYSGMTSIVYPKYLNGSIDQNFNRMAKIPMDFDVQPVSTRAGNIATIAEIGYFQLTSSHPIPYLHPVLVDDYYVFSKAFYEQAGTKSLLEVLTENYLQRQDNRPDQVLKLATSVHRWGGLEQFYYLPILMVLIKAALGDF